jgi:hypothetical protein
MFKNTNESPQPQTRHAFLCKVSIALFSKLAQ